MLVHELISALQQVDPNLPVALLVAATTKSLPNEVTQVRIVQRGARYIPDDGALIAVGTAVVIEAFPRPINE